MSFVSTAYGSAVAEILALDGDGYRLMPLVAGLCSPDQVQPLIQAHTARTLFPSSFAPEAALGGLWLYFSCYDNCHQIVQDMNTAEASLWHAILHRQEPDSGNAAYWLRRAGNHPIYTDLRVEADRILEVYPDAEFRTGGKWDPFSFVLFCERARQQPGSASELAAREMQRAEWQLLFHHCARNAT